ncbi:MAG: class I SAM-dependent methyltransferase [Xanthomonadales bacterium]|jgi:hypothetical protein|nr:class I SAM-dependent methyltransferase [Xanthomonadales bacterium]
MQQKIRQLLHKFRAEEAPLLKSRTISASHPNGHFYSPVTDPADLLERQQELWPAQAPECPGLSFNDENHERVLAEWFPKFIGDYDYPEHEKGPTGYFTQNSQFSWLDSRTLFVLLHALRPGRVIEIGSGFSSLLTADVNHRFLDGQIDFTCIEPYPRAFLKKQIPGLSRLMVERVESIDRDFFSSLQPGDILFIDSSHVSKTGSDVNYLYFEILPRLPRGVFVHIHDIFLPFEYPKDWAITENRSWNEQYLLRALLMNSTAYRVFFGCNYAFHAFNSLVANALGFADKRAFAGGSFWIEKIT